MSLTVKAYLTKKGIQAQEIRRFSVDQDVSTNFVYLTKKVILVFPALQDKTFYLRWKDSENDLVSFSSDEELVQALGFVDDGVFKIYIEEVPETRPKSSERSSAHCGGGARDILHPGVRCDGCEGPVFGTRFKCQTCPDFDLCQGCRQTGLHGEHAFDDIHTPRNPFKMFEGQMGDFFRAMPQFWLEGGILPPRFPHWASEPNENQRSDAPPHRDCRGMRKAWRKLYSEMYGKKHGKRHDCAHGGVEKKTEKTEAEANGEPLPAENEKTAKKAREEKKEKDNEKKERDNDVEESSSDEEEGSEAAEGQEDYLKAIGKTVEDFLKPFGIDVEAIIKSQEAPTSKGQSDQQTDQTPSEPHRHHFDPREGPFGSHSRPCGPQGFPFRPTGGSFGCHGPQRESFSPRGGSCGPRGGSCGPRRGSCRPETTSAHHSVPSGHPAGPFGWTFGPFGPQGRPWGPFNMGPQGTTSGGKQEHETPASGAEQQTKTNSGAAFEAEREIGEAGNPLPQNGGEVLIVETVKAMKEMGFSDHGGWLTALVRAHGGDIGRALDAIHATHSN